MRYIIYASEAEEFSVPYWKALEVNSVNGVLGFMQGVQGSPVVKSVRVCDGGDFAVLEWNSKEGLVPPSIPGSGFTESVDEATGIPVIDLGKPERPDRRER